MNTTKLIWNSAMKSDEYNSFVLGKPGQGESFSIKTALINTIFKEDKNNTNNSPKTK